VTPIYRITPSGPGNGLGSVGQAAGHGSRLTGIVTFDTPSDDAAVDGASSNDRHYALVECQCWARLSQQTTSSRSWQR
jgi:hypothetical protein